MSKNNSPRINVATRLQQGGTCWFHAIISGLIMSKICRRYLLKVIRERGLSPTKSALKTGACPRTIDGFWKYIAYRLKGPKSISPRIRNVNAIKAAGLRRNKIANFFGFIPRFGNTLSTYRRRALASRTSVTGGTVSDLYNLYKKLFGNDFMYQNKNKNNGNTKPPVFILRKGNDFPYFFNHKGDVYTLSHAYIVMMGVGGVWGHAVSGILNNNNYVVYDSAHNNTVRWWWRTSEDDKNALTFFNKRYDLPRYFNLRTIKKYAVYIRYDVSSEN